MARTVSRACSRMVPSRIGCHGWAVVVDAPISGLIRRSLDIVVLPYSLIRTLQEGVKGREPMFARRQETDWRRPRLVRRPPPRNLAPESLIQGYSMAQKGGILICPWL